MVVCRSDRTTRRGVCCGVLAVGSGLLAGCFDGEQEAADGPEGEDDEEEETEADPRIPLNDRALNASFPIGLVDPDTDEYVARMHGHGGDDHWHVAPWEIPSRETATAEVEVLDAEYNEIPLGEKEPYGLEAEVPEADPGGILEVEVQGDVLEARADESGKAKIAFELRHDGEVAWTPPPLRVTVSE